MISVIGVLPLVLPIVRSESPLAHGVFAETGSIDSWIYFSLYFNRLMVGTFDDRPAPKVFTVLVVNFELIADGKVLAVESILFQFYWQAGAHFPFQLPSIKPAKVDTSRRCPTFEHVVLGASKRAKIIFTTYSPSI